MAGYSKLFSSIVTSSIWCEDNVVLRVWIAMLATCNADGVVDGAVTGFASLARVGVDDMRRALEVLMSPDPDSRTPDNEGRRIEAVPGGWRILNYQAYRDRLQSKPGSNAEHQKAYRDRTKAKQLQQFANKTITPHNALSSSITPANSRSPVSAPASAYASASTGEPISKLHEAGDDWDNPFGVDQ